MRGRDSRSTVPFEVSHGQNTESNNSCGRRCGYCIAIVEAGCGKGIASKIQIEALSFSKHQSVLWILDTVILK
jgi:hypothetical protein